jgi:acetyl esterase/lipase
MGATSSIAATVVGKPSLSADARWAAWLIGGAAGPELVLFDVDRACVADRVVAQAERCRAFVWTQMPGIGLGVAHGAGSEAGRLHRFDAADRSWRRIAGVDGLQERLVGVSVRRPAEILVARQRGDNGARDYDVVSLDDDRCETVWHDDGQAAVYFDHTFAPRLIEVLNADGSRDLLHAKGGTRFLHVPATQAMLVRVLGFSADGDRIHLVVPHGGTGSRVVAFACMDGRAAAEPRELFRVERAALTDVLAAVPGGDPRLARVERLRMHLVAIDPALRPALKRWHARFGRGGDVVACPDRGPWIVSRRSDDGSERHGLWSPETDAWVPLTDDAAGRTHRIARAPLPRPAYVATRDGHRMVVHVTRPMDAAPSAALPVALVVHGGPWRRVPLGHDARRAELADAGFLVVEPNFRGSTNAGSDWINAGDRQWGLAMQNDLEDALAWVIERRWADPERIALVGGSYGGYAVLQMAASTHFDVRAVVATSPLTDIAAFVRVPPKSWGSSQPMLLQRIGDPEVDARKLQDTSPLANAGAIRCPVLLLHGYHDVRLPVAGTTQMFMALAQAGREASLALFLDEGHEVVGAANRDAWKTLLRRFLACHVFGGPSRLHDAHSPWPAGMKWLQSPAAARANDEGAGDLPPPLPTHPGLVSHA